jgi:hypothetical protein
MLSRILRGAEDSGRSASACASWNISVHKRRGREGKDFGKKKTEGHNKYLFKPRDEANFTAARREQKLFHFSAKRAV